MLGERHSLYGHLSGGCTTSNSALLKDKGKHMQKLRCNISVLRCLGSVGAEPTVYAPAEPTVFAPAEPTVLAPCSDELTLTVAST